MEGARLSKRGLGNVEAIWPRISEASAERDEINTGAPVIDLSTSENWLVRNELIALYKKAVQDSFGCNVSADLHLRPIQTEDSGTLTSMGWDAASIIPCIHRRCRSYRCPRRLLQLLLQTQYTS